MTDLRAPFALHLLPRATLDGDRGALSRQLHRVELRGYLLEFTWRLVELYESHILLGVRQIHLNWDAAVSFYTPSTDWLSMSSMIP